ncbi:MAG: hypothetical protein HY365_03170 [Candidatus Aenigmarchaeota archaeon]|nr:hypothetical protein [Candidatus Aenigmarchaeota archaeon]
MTIADIFIANVEQLGFFDFLLPWLFTFAITYGLLIKADIFGAANAKISVVLAVVFAFFTAPFAGIFLKSFFSTLSTEMVIVLGGLLTIILFATILGIERSSLPYRSYAAIALGAIAFFIAIGGEVSGIRLGSNTVMTAVFVIILLAAIGFVTGSAPAAAPKEEKK